jgi:two-component system CheB/CheR fusion protein
VSIRRSVVSDVYADEGLLSHLIQNLIDNAIKYNDKSVPVVEIHGETEDGVWLMHIVDNGIGFDESLAESIFKPFHRLVTKEEYDGSGVGLSICKAIVDMHCGEIVVKSTKGQGSEFTVKLPLTLGSN